MRTIIGGFATSALKDSKLNNLLYKTFLKQVERILQTHNLPF